MEGTTRRTWLEIVRIRSLKEAEEQIRAIIETAKKGGTFGDAIEVRVFSNSVGDLAVHISRESDETAGKESLMALRLAAALAEHGLIDHTIWKEEV